MYTGSILFSPAMAKAIRQGTKTQTRRLVVPQPLIEDVEWPTISSCVTWGDVVEDADHYVACGYCPHGKVGSRLWVRERWRTLAKWDNLSPLAIIQEVTHAPRSPRLPIWYADDTTVEWTEQDEPGRWRASIHMPQALAQTSITLTSIQVQRVNSLTAYDAIQEGISQDVVTHSLRRTYGHIWSVNAEATAYTDAFATLWNTIHTTDFTWQENPWVWALTFEVAPIMLNDQAHQVKFEQMQHLLEPAA